VTQSFDGRPLARPRPLDIYWVEQMTFDGLTARFFGDVQGAMNDDTMVNRMRCQEMQVVLTEKVRFSGPPRRQEVRLRNVLCEGGVEFDSDESAGGKRIDIRRMTGARFSLDQVTGAIQGQGPGTITRWQYGQGRPSGLGPISNVRANSPLKPNAAEWTYTRVRFAGRMSGNMNQRSSTFHDDVDILYGPVAKESDTIDRNRLGEESGWLGCNVLTVTQHPETPTSPAYAELLAEGNARLEGQTYNGRADSISYDGSKGLFVLRAEGNGTATIWRQKQLGSSYSQNDAQQMEFIPRSNKLKLNQVTGLNAVE